MSIRCGAVYCRYCNKLIVNPHGNQVYHKECAKKMREEGNRIRKVYKRKNASTYSKKDKHGLTLSEIMRLANKEGLQYGEYCMKHHLYENEGRS